MRKFHCFPFPFGDLTVRLKHFLAGCSLGAIALSTPFLNGQDVQVPSDSKFVLSLELQALQSSQVGKAILGAIESNVHDELKSSIKKWKSKESNKDASDSEFTIEKVKDVLGINPLEEIRQIVVSSADLENPEKSMLMQIGLKKNTGNIEGLLLQLPHYASSEVGNLTIHSAKVDGETGVHGCIQKMADGNHVITISGSKERLLESVSVPKGPAAATRTVRLDDDRKSILHLQVLDIPKIDIGEGPQANIAKLLTGMNFSLSESGENLELRATMQTASDKKATQLKQACSGLVAMLDLFVSMEEKPDKEMEMIAGHLKKVKVTQDDATVRIVLAIPSDEVAQFLKEELKD
jgi:ribosome-associated translation inhibitor RaiA